MSHLSQGNLTQKYSDHLGRKTAFLIGLILTGTALLVIAISLGVARVPIMDILRVLIGADTDSKFHTIIYNIRLPHALAAILAGAGLAGAGVVMQSVLRNPLGSPFTLGISQAGAFGAAFAVMLPLTILKPYLTTLSAFSACMVVSLVIIAIARMRGVTPEVMVLSGVALGALFSAGIMFLQYFADDAQLAAMVFWTFGDVGRAGWGEVGIMALVVTFGLVFFILNRWNYNAIDAGDEIAKSLGVEVTRVRMLGMIVSSFLTAVIVSFLGIIGFVGLICPHIVRRFVGDDHRFLLPGACLTGAALLLAADTAARLVLEPHVLPVAVFTAFLGAPAFLYILCQRRRR